MRRCVISGCVTIFSPVEHGRRTWREFYYSTWQGKARRACFYVGLAFLAAVSLAGLWLVWK